MAVVPERTRRAAAARSWPSVKTSARTVTGSPIVALAGNAPPSTSGDTASTTTRLGRAVGRGCSFEGDVGVGIGRNPRYRSGGVLTRPTSWLRVITTVGDDVHGHGRAVAARREWTHDRRCRRADRRHRPHRADRDDAVRRRPRDRADRRHRGGGHGDDGSPTRSGHHVRDPPRRGDHGHGRQRRCAVRVPQPPARAPTRRRSSRRPTSSAACARVRCTRRPARCTSAAPRSSCRPTSSTTAASGSPRSPRPRRSSRDLTVLRRRT